MKRKYEIAVISKNGYARTVRIYAPKSADRAIIMHDGQNVFYDEDAAYKKSWRALDALKSAGVKNTAIIGVDCTPTRMDDYLPFPIELDEYKPSCGGTGGKAAEYFDYLEEMLLPYLDKRFGFKKYAMLGSSAGALATLGFAARKPAKFIAYGLFSAPLFICPAAYEKFFDALSLDGDAYYQAYCGGSELSGELDDPELIKAVPQLYVQSAFTLTDALRRGGAKKLTLTVNNEGVHDETCWRAPEKEFFAAFSAL